MAHGWLDYFSREFSPQIEVVSAGVETHGVNPKAILVMKEVEVDISDHTSNHIDQYIDSGITHVITVCDSAAEKCPIFPERIIVSHQSFNDPAKATGSEENILNQFRKVRDEIKEYTQSYLKELVSETMV